MQPRHEHYRSRLPPGTGLVIVTVLNVCFWLTVVLVAL